MSFRSSLVRRSVSLLVPALLVAAAAFSFAGCGSSASGSDTVLTLQGVELKELLDLATAPASATSVYSAASNDDAVTLRLSIPDHPGAILATRVVFSDDHPDTTNESPWIWSTKTLAVR